MKISKQITWLFLAIGMFIFSAIANAQVVKMSKANICHDINSPYYSRVKNFKAYDTLASCLAAGGRVPKGTKDPANQTSLNNNVTDYSRSAFAHWRDYDGDCMNTRHELLLELSTGKVALSEDGCRVLRGRWNDPYSGQIFFDSSHLDIDHLVPLFWAWEQGASFWTDYKREQFANDPINLFAVSASLNRIKGSKGPDLWLPPNRDFHCQYVSRYLRVMIKYEFSAKSLSKVREIVANNCN